MNKKPLTYIKENIGKCPFCNEKPNTAPHIGSFCFPVCWRCFALIVSIVVTYLLAHVIIKAVFPLWLSLLLVLPTAIDGILQYFFQVQSNNPRRCITGFISGIGIAMTILYIPQFFNILGF